MGLTGLAVKEKRGEQARWEVKIGQVYPSQLPLKTDCAVMIDLLGAFTASAYALAYGAKRVVVIDDVHEACQLRKQLPDSLLMGESEAKEQALFDLDNSAFSLLAQDLAGKTIIHTSSSASKAAAGCFGCKTVLIYSFVVAKATVSLLKARRPREVHLVICGGREASEEIAAAEYLEKSLKAGIGDEVDPRPFLERAFHSPKAQRVRKSAERYPDFSMDEVDAAVALDLFSFAMEMQTEGNLRAITAVEQRGASQG